MPDGCIYQEDLLHLFTVLRNSAVIALAASATLASAAVGNSTPGLTSSSRFVGLNSVPSIKVVADGDMSPANAIATADFDKQHGADIATIQRDGMLNIVYNDSHGNFGAMYSNNSALSFEIITSSIPRSVSVSNPRFSSSASSSLIKSYC